MERQIREKVSSRQVQIKDAVFFMSNSFANPVMRLRSYGRLITYRRYIEQKLRESELKLSHLASQLLTAQERERERISRDLHDDLGQSLVFLKLQFQGVARNLSSDQSELRSAFDDWINYIDNILESVRRLAKDLRPSVLKDMGLSAALKNLFNNFRQNYDADMSLTMEDIEDLFSPEGNLIIYRIFQEVLTNIAKYAQATKVSIDIRIQNMNAVFTIIDNGKGFDVKRVLAGDSRSRGLGMWTMQERVNSLGGSLDIWSPKGRGTKISFTLPFSR